MPDDPKPVVVDSSKWPIALKLAVLIHDPLPNRKKNAQLVADRIAGLERENERLREIVKDFLGGVACVHIHHNPKLASAFTKAQALAAPEAKMKGS